MDTQVMALDVCKHYDEIIEFSYRVFDQLTGRIIKDFKELVFTTNSNSAEKILKIKVYEALVYQYISDRYFYKYVQKINEQDQKNALYEYDFVSYLQKCYEDYNKDKVRNINGSNWI